MKKGLMSVGFAVVGGVVGALTSKAVCSKEVKLKGQKVDKFKSYYTLLNQWLILKNNNQKIEDFFVKNKYQKVAIYGMGELGNRLYEELKDSNIQITYAVDKNVAYIYSELKIIDVDENYEDVDVMVVTAIADYDDIRDAICDKISCPIISLEDVIYEL